MYDSEISRKKPALITIMLDRSTSMNDHFCGQKGESSKADGVADAVNRVIHNIVIKYYLKHKIFWEVKYLINME